MKTIRINKLLWNLLFFFAVFISVSGDSKMNPDCILYGESQDQYCETYNVDSNIVNESDSVANQIDRINELNDEFDEQLKTTEELQEEVISLINKLENKGL